MPKMAGDDDWDWTQAVAWIAFDVLDARRGTIQAQEIYEVFKSASQAEQAKRAVAELLHELVNRQSIKATSADGIPDMLNTSPPVYPARELAPITETLTTQYLAGGYSLALSRTDWKEWQNRVRSYFGGLRFDRSVILEHWPPSEPKEAVIAPPSDDEYLSPFIRFMIQATRENGVTKANQVNVESLRGWIETNWDERLLGEKKEIKAKVRMMGTLMREPDAKGKASSKKG